MYLEKVIDDGLYKTSRSVLKFDNREIKMPVLMRIVCSDPSFVFSRVHALSKHL